MDLIEKTENQRRHPWEISRGSCILKILQKNGQEADYADIGAGDKYFSLELRAITTGKVFAVDNGYKNEKSEEDGIICLNEVSILENSSLDCIVMMDVLEHIENENEFLKSVLDKLRPGGRILLTVPAMQYLFSFHDVFLKHYRRYDRKQLFELLFKNGITIEQSHYFYSVLFVQRCLSVVIEKYFPNKNRKNVGIGRWRYNKNSFITRLLVLILNLDFSLNKLLCKYHVYLPGLSLLAVCRKKHSEDCNSSVIG